MSSLQPIQALSLDSVQQQAFIKYFHSLPEKPATTVRIFDRNDYYSVHGADASTAAREVFSTVANIKKMGLEPNKLDYLVLSKGNFEILIKKLLLVRRYRVEIYVAEGSVKGSDWSLKYKGSPGYLSQLEEILGEGLGASDDTTPCLMAVHIKTDAVTKVSFREELKAELKFILSFSGDTKPVRHRESTGSGSGGSKDDGEKNADAESPDDDDRADPSPTPRSERSGHSHHTLHSRRQSNAVQMAKMRKYSLRSAM